MKLRYGRLTFDKAKETRTREPKEQEILFPYRIYYRRKNHDVLAGASASMERGYYRRGNSYVYARGYSFRTVDGNAVNNR